MGIATDSAINGTARCMFPSDANSDHRKHDGCGENQYPNPFPNPFSRYRKAGDGYDWCDAYEPPRAPGGTLLGQCALRANQSAEMMEVWNNQAHNLGQYSAYNEVVVDGAKWNSSISED